MFVGGPKNVNKSLAVVNMLLTFCSSFLLKKIPKQDYSSNPHGHLCFVLSGFTLYVHAWVCVCVEGTCMSNIFTDFSE